MNWIAENARDHVPTLGSIEDKISGLEESIRIKERFLRTRMLLTEDIREMLQKPDAVGHRLADLQDRLERSLKNEDYLSNVIAYMGQELEALRDEERRQQRQEQAHAARLRGRWTRSSNMPTYSIAKRFGISRRYNDAFPY